MLSAASPLSSRFFKRDGMRARLLQIEIKKCRTGYSLQSLPQQPSNYGLRLQLYFKTV